MIENTHKNNVPDELDIAIKAIVEKHSDHILEIVVRDEFNTAYQNIQKPLRLTSPIDIQLSGIPKATELPVRAIWKIDIQNNTTFAVLQKIKVDAERLSDLYDYLQTELPEATFELQHLRDILLSVVALKEHDLVFSYDRFISPPKLLTHKEIHRLLGWEVQNVYLEKLANYIGVYPHRFHKDAPQVVEVIISMLKM